MKNITYACFEDVDPTQLMSLLNQSDLREHLIDHPYFDSNSIQLWLDEKIKINNKEGCLIRAVNIDEELAGWCGIQPDEDGFELAIVISKSFWGNGVAIFKDLMRWSKDIGHKEVHFHLLDTRREYKSLKKMATKVTETKLLGHNFKTYYFS